VVDVETRDRATPGEEVPIEVGIALPEAESFDVTVTATVVVSVDGQEIDRREVQVSDGGTVTFNVTPGSNRAGPPP